MSAATNGPAAGPPRTHPIGHPIDHPMDAGPIGIDAADLDPAVAAGPPLAPPPGRGGLLALVRRAGWNLLDQMLSAGTNAALSFLVARNVGVKGFGAFAVGFLVFTLLIGVGRAVVGQPLSIRYSSQTPAEMRSAVARGMGTVVALTVAAGLLMALAGLLIGGILRPTLLAFALVLPALVLQDNCRSVFFAQGRPDLATLNDGLWAVVQFAAVVTLIRTQHASAWSLALAWGASAAVCAVVGMAQLRVLPRVSASLGWLREHRDLVGYLVAEYLLGAGALQGGILLIGGFLGIAAIGSLRAAMVLTGPLGVLLGAAMAFGLPEVSRRSTLSSARRWQVAIAVTGVMTVAGLVYTGVLLLIPDSLGSDLFRQTWAGASAVLLPISLVSVCAGACLGPVIVLLALGQGRAMFRMTAIEAVMVLIALLLGAALGGVAGAAWGLAIQYTILVPLWFVQLRAVLRANDAAAPQPAL